MTSNIIQALWIGARLSLMERLAIRSFLHHGHEFHLYLYGPCEGVPPGTTVRDGREILPGAEIFHYQSGYGKGSVAAFSDLFRYTLLFERGGWWVDLDVVALQPFRFDGDYVLGLANGSRGRTYVAAGAIHAPRASQLMARCMEVAGSIDRNRVEWGEIGPRLLGRTARELGMESAMQPPSVFYPIDAKDFWAFLRPGQAVGEAVAVHLWAQLWRHYGMDPDGRYADTSVYEQLIRRYLPETAADPRARVNLTAAMIRSLPRRASAGAWFWIRRLRRRLGRR